MARKKTARSRSDNTELTSLGVPLHRTSDTECLIDLRNMRPFTGLSVVARLIGEELLDQIESDTPDIVLQRKVVGEITPELLSAGVQHITLFALANVLSSLPEVQTEFHNQLRTVFGTLQRPRWGRVLFPELYANNEQFPDAKSGQALLFPFHLHSKRADIDYFILIEREPGGKMLRITIEPEKNPRVNLASIPHQVVDDLDRRTYLQGLTRITESIYLGILRECENLRNEYTDNARRHTHFFQQLQRVGLESCDSIAVRWPQDYSESLVRGRRGDVVLSIKRTLIVLEDRAVVSELRAGRTINVKTGAHTQAFLDLSHRGRALNISLHSKRDASRVEYYLDRMPRLKEVSLERPRAFEDTRIFLIHHITGEILATIRAIENMGAEFLEVLFVKYAGVVPSDYQEALLTLSEDRFRFHGLQRVDSEERIGGYYLLSNQYSDVSGLEALESALAERKLDFFGAMCLAAGHLFLREALRAKRDKKTLLLIEDGGYLAPLLNEAALEKKTLAETMQQFAVDSSDDFQPTAAEKRQSIGAFLKGVMPGSVEHTRNGYNRLLAVQEACDTLAFPAASIAVSNIKRERESQEVSISILHAVESIFHGLGLVFSERHALILGSRGAIGCNLMEDLHAKLGAERIVGVDVQNKARPDFPWLETSSYARVPEPFVKNIDVVLGVVGKSILRKKELEDLILKTNSRHIFFASGSTKTAEFTDLSDWIESLRRAKNPKIGTQSLQLDVQPVRDPQTQFIVASRVRLRIGSGARAIVRDLYLLGGLTPINFLFYGVPTETMDPILAQLLQVSAGLLRESRSRTTLPPRLLAVDEAVDAECRLLDDT